MGQRLSRQIAATARAARRILLTTDRTTFDDLPDVHHRIALPDQNDRRMTLGRALARLTTACSLLVVSDDAVVVAHP